MSKSKADAKKRRTFMVFTIPGFLLYSAFFIFPILMGAYYSLTDWDGVKKKFNMIGMQNYVKIFQDKQFINALGFTLKYSLFLIILTIILAVCLALFLNQSVKGRGFFRSMYFIPAVLSMLTVGLIFNQIFYYILPPIGKALGNPTLSKSLLSSPRMAIWAILFVNLWQGLPIPTLLILAGLQSIPMDLLEAASLDGARDFQKFRFITVPFILPVLSVVFVLTLKGGLMVFDYIQSMTGGGPGGATRSIALLIYEHGFTQNKYAYSIAEAIIAGIIIAAISAVQITFTNKKKGV